MTRRILLTLTPLAALAIAVAGCGGGSGDVPSNAVAVVTKCDKPITKNDYSQVLNQAQVNYKRNNQKFPGAGTQEYRQVQNQIVSYLVLREAYICEGEDMDVDVSDSDIDKKVDELVKQYYKGDKTKFEKALKDQGVAPGQLRQEVAMQLYQKGIFDKVTTGSSAKVSDKELRDYYTKNKAQYETPATRTVRHILVKKKALADDLERQLKNGAAFAALVKKYSQDPGSKKTGGKLTDLAQDATVPPFDKAAFAIKTNAISQPVKTQYGWHIIQALTPVKPKNVTKFEDVKAQIQQIVSQSKKTELGQKWAEDFRKNLQKASAVKYQAGYQPPQTSTSGTTTSG
ncbi:MAG: peptidylprolyl isomerase [Gaiellaceae bacterium]